MTIEWDDDYDCIDCGKHCGSQPDQYLMFMVYECVWTEAELEWIDCLCQPCLEARLGRKLVAGDFDASPCNYKAVPEPLQEAWRKWHGAAMTQAATPNAA